MRRSVIKKSEVNVFVMMKMAEMYREKTFDWWKDKWNIASSIVDAIMDDNNEAYCEILSGSKERRQQVINTVMLKTLCLNECSVPKNKTECLKNVVTAFSIQPLAFIETFGVDAFYDWTVANSDDPDKLICPPENWMKEQIEKVCQQIENICEEVADEDQKKRAERIASYNNEDF